MGSVPIFVMTAIPIHSIEKNHNCSRKHNCNSATTLSPAYNEFGYNVHPAVTSKFLCIKIIDCNVKKFGYNEHPLTMTSFFCIFY